jgi:hypothetical protein
MNATQNPAKPAYKRAPQRLFYIDVTDTFAGEANYSWVTRHIIRASTERGAVNKFSRLSGMEWRGAGCERYDSKSGATCFFLSAYTHDEHSQFLSYSTDERTDLEKLGAEIFGLVYGALSARYKKAGSPAHGTELVLWDMERVRCNMRHTRTVKEIFADAVVSLGEWLDCADEVTSEERGILARAKAAV